VRKIIAIEFVTLDGIIQSPGARDEDREGGFDRGGWIADYADSVLGALIKGRMAMPFDLLLGRKTYDIWASHWPLHGDVWPEANRATKYVASRTRKEGDWGPARFIGGPVAAGDTGQLGATVRHAGGASTGEESALPDAVWALKATEGPDLHVYGSADLLQTLFAHELVDALWLMIHPIALGAGKRLFAREGPPARFRLTRCESTETGVIIADYERVLGGPAESRG